MGTQEYKDILRFAVRSEVLANKYYLEIAKKAKNNSARQLFEELAADELGHKDDLEAYLKTDAKPLVFAKVIDYKISENVKKPEISGDMTFLDAVALAMKNEQDAMDMYNAMAAASQSIEQKKMFEALALMEKGNKAKLEDIYNNSAYVEVW